MSKFCSYELRVRALKWIEVGRDIGPKKAIKRSTILKKLSKILGKYDTTTIWRGIQTLGYRDKKTCIHPKRNAAAREEFIKKVEKIQLKKWVYLDESVIEDNTCLTHGWSARGTRCYGKKIY